MSRKANDEIFKWRENLEMLPDDIFFNLVHIYIGEVRTPYNKQNLVEKIEAFIRTQENQQTILAYLDPFDKEIISFIFFVPETTQEKISTFFSDGYTPAQITARLQNLHERLIIYTESPNSTHKFLQINPVLTELLSPHISLSNLLQENNSSKNEKFVPCTKTNLSPNLIASFISYIMGRPDLCKADGTLKKTDASKLETIFPERLELIQNLLTSLVNLSLINNDEKNLKINKSRMNEFIKLTEREQYAYLCVAATCPMSRTLLYTQAQLLLDCLDVIPVGGFSRKILLRTAFLIAETKKNSSANSLGRGRFSRILAAAATDDATLAHEDRSAQILFDRTIDTALIFGLIEQAKNIPAQSKEIKSEKKEASVSEIQKKVITISGLSVTIVPGLSFSDLLQIIPFLSVTQYNTAVSFEISHASVFRAFDSGYGSKQICSLLEKYSAFDIPQSIKATLEDWEQSYHSAVLYKGYVLHLDEKKAQIFEKNPNIPNAIIKKLAPGVYFLDITNDDEANYFSRVSGLDFIGSIKNATRETSSLPFMTLHNDTSEEIRSQFFAPEQPYKKPEDEIAIKRNIIAALDTFNFSKNKHDALAARIERKIILSPAQLSTSYVPQALLEAHGVDFSGKIHILESALQAHEKVTITLPDEKNPSGFVKHTGTPIFVNKKSTPAELVLQLDKSNDIKKFSIAQLTKIKWHKKL